MKSCIIYILTTLILTTPARAGVVGFVDQNGIIQFYQPYQPGQIRMPPVAAVTKNKPEKKPKQQSIETLISQAQRKHGIESALIKAVIHAESNFNPAAVSKKGAKGLMQIMPDNYAALSISDPFDPHQNIMGGTRLLKDLIYRYDHRLDLALAAYNAGTIAVDKYGKVPPYKETQHYVTRVIDLYTSYK